MWVGMPPLAAASVTVPVFGLVSSAPAISSIWISFDPELTTVMTFVLPFFVETSS
jgi:hypothetical protein